MSMKFRISSLTFKLFIICFLFVFGSVSLLSQLSYQFVQNEVRTNNDFFINQMLSKVDQYINLSFSSLQTILFAIDSSYTQGTDEVESLTPELQKLYDLNLNLVSNVYVIKKDTSIVGGSPLTPAFDEPNEQRIALQQEAIANKLTTLTSLPYFSRQSGWTVTMEKYLHNSNPDAVVALDMDLNTIDNTLLQINRDDLVSLVIIDATGTVIAGSLGQAGILNTKDHTFSLGGITSKEILKLNNTFQFKSEAKENWTARKLLGSRFGWTILSLNSESFTKRSLHNLEKYFIILLSIGLLLSAIIAAFVTRFIRKPLGYLMTKMNLIKQGYLDVPIMMNRKDEFGELSRTFDMMIRQIKELLANLRSNRELKRELEIQVLQSQINPHFLYNTLGSIGNVVRLGMHDQVDPIIGSLIKILEYGIEDVTETVTLREELLNVRDYIFIQNIRYNHVFEIEEEIEAGLLEFPVFRMLLQPIVENSLFHGYNGGRLQGKIRIAAYRDEEQIRVEVSDYGVGMVEEQRIQLLQPGTQRRPDKRKRIGLFNIHQRMLLNYGENYGLEIESEIGQGTLVRAIFPNKQPEGGTSE
jgi:two-component system sensor histidine kinase YesM